MIRTYLNSSSIRQHEPYPYARKEADLKVPTTDMIRMVSAVGERP